MAVLREEERFMINRMFTIAVDRLFDKYSFIVFPAWMHDIDLLLIPTLLIIQVDHIHAFSVFTLLLGRLRSASAIEILLVLL